MTRAQMREERIRMILDITKQMVLIHGIGANLMSEIAAQCGISRQRLYKYFSNAEEAIKALAVRSIEEINSYLDEKLLFCTAIPSEQEAFRQYITAKIQVICNAPAKIHDDILYITLFDAYMTKNKPDFRRDQQGAIVNMTDMLMDQILMKGQEKGIFRKDISSRPLMYWMNQTILSYAYRYVLTKTDSKAGLLNNEEAFRWLADSILRYIMV